MMIPEDVASEPGFPDMIEHDEASNNEQGSTTFSPDAQPIIGIPLPVTQDQQGQILVVDAVSAWAVERMGGRILFLPLWSYPTHTHLYQSLWPVVSSIDGLLLPAGIQGTDWYACWSEGKHHPGPTSWPMCWEMALAQFATALDMPILAIGDGAEQWNCALGGTCSALFRDGEQGHATTPETWTRHTIRVRAPSRLASALQSALSERLDESLPWNLAFMPHRGIERIATGLRSCAQSEDGSMVAFERRDATFGMGIVGRVDWGLDQVYGITLFESFLEACHAFDQLRLQHGGWETERETLCATLSTRVALGQSLLSSVQEEEHPLARSSFLRSTDRESEGQDRIRQWPHHPTKQELNRMRRQKLKGVSR